LGKYPHYTTISVFNIKFEILHGDIEKNGWPILEYFDITYKIHKLSSVSS